MNALLANMVCGQSVFNTYYTAGANTKSYGNRIETFAEDSTYLVYGPWQDQTSQQGIRLLRLNKNGAVLADGKFMVPNNLVYAPHGNNQLAIKTSTYSSLILGATYFGNDPGLVLFKANNKLADTIHTRYYSDNIYRYYLNTRFRKDKKQVWFFGSREKPNDNSYLFRPVLFKVDTNGNYLGQTEFPAMAKIQPWSVHYDSVAKRIYFGCADYNVDPTISRVICMDTLGNVDWNIPFLQFHDLNYMEKPNGYLYIAGSKFIQTIGNDNYYKLVLMKIDCSSGSVVWQKTYGNQGTAVELKALVINDNESIIASGSFKYPTPVVSPRNDGVILKVNSNGDSLWMRTYSTYTSSIREVFYDIKKAPDGGYILCGSPEYLSDCKTWVVKTDGNGNGPGENTGINEFEVQGLKFKVSPNPAAEQFYVEVEDASKNMQLIVTDALGRTILEEELTGIKTEINAAALEEGIYFVSVKQDAFRSVSTKLVIVK